jgi:hypothetical protein
MFKSEPGGMGILKTTPPENRQLKDRRARPTRFISRYTLTGRRRKARRQAEANNYYVDKFESRYLIMIGLVMIFCILDYGLSFKIFQKGGSELNVLISSLMINKRALLLLAKLGLTVVCLGFILFHKNFKVFGLIRAHVLIYYVFSVYLVLIIYEFYSLALISKFESFP